MILLSLVLVLAAAVLLVVGWFQDGLALIYLSIGACLLAMLLLGASVLLRRRDAVPAASTAGTAPASAASGAIGRPPVARPSTATTASGDADPLDAPEPGEAAAPEAAAPDWMAEPVEIAEPVDAAEPDAAVEAVEAVEAVDPSPTGRASRRAAVVRKSATRPADPASEPVAVDGGDPLADVRGLGPSRREALLERFGDVAAIRAAGLDELTAVPGMTPGLAEAVKQQLDRS